MFKINFYLYWDFIDFTFFIALMSLGYSFLILKSDSSTIKKLGNDRMGQIEPYAPYGQQMNNRIILGLQC